jgi:hypothetical protein
MGAGPFCIILFFNAATSCLCCHFACLPMVSYQPKQLYLQEDNLCFKPIIISYFIYEETLNDIIRHHGLALPHASGPVTQWGQLQVKGNQLCDQQGMPSCCAA